LSAAAKEPVFTRPAPAAAAFLARKRVKGFFRGCFKGGFVVCVYGDDQIVGAERLQFGFIEAKPHKQIDVHGRGHGHHRFPHTRHAFYAARREHKEHGVVI
jgi:hypothetical protein